MGKKEEKVKIKNSIYLLTVEGVNLREVLLPPQVLLVNIAQVAYEKGLFGIRFALGSQLGGSDYTLPEMNLWMSAV